MVHTYAKTMRYTHTLEYYSVLTRKEIVTHEDMCSVNKTVTKRQTEQDFTYVSYVEESNSQKKKVGSGCQGQREEEVRRCCVIGTELQFCKMRKFWRLATRQRECTSLHLKTGEQYVFTLCVL